MAESSSFIIPYLSSLLTTPSQVLGARSRGAFAIMSGSDDNSVRRAMTVAHQLLRRSNRQRTAMLGTVGDSAGDGGSSGGGSSSSSSSSSSSGSGNGGGGGGSFGAGVGYGHVKGTMFDVLIATPGNAPLPYVSSLGSHRMH